MTNSPILLTLKETAELVGYSRGYIKTLADRNEFPAIMRVGSSDRLHFNARAVRKWIRKRLAANNGKIHRAGGRPLVTRPNSERPTLTGLTEKLDTVETRLLTIERYILRTGKRRKPRKRSRPVPAPAATKALHNLVMAHIRATPPTLSVTNAKQVLAHFKVARVAYLSHEQALAGKAMVEKMVEAGPTFASTVQWAVTRLDPDVDSHWVMTGAHKGKPKLQAVEDAYGRGGITRQDVEAAMPGYNRDAACEAYLSS